MVHVHLNVKQPSQIQQFKTKKKKAAQIQQFKTKKRKIFSKLKIKILDRSQLNLL